MGKSDGAGVAQGHEPLGLVPYDVMTLYSGTGTGGRVREPMSRGHSSAAVPLIQLAMSGGNSTG